MKTISPKKRKFFPGSLILFGLSLLWWNFGYLALSKFPSSDIQRTLLHRSREISKSKSDSAIHKNLELFNHPTLYKYLTIFDDGSHLFTLNGSTLLTMFYNELSVMELVHNFDEYMYSVEFLDTHPFLYNQWQMRSAGLINDTFSNVTANEEAETFGFPAFKSDQPTFEEASDRPFYGALNMYRNSAGNPNFGDISLVLNTNLIHDQILGASIDTGWYGMNCKAGFHFGMFCDRVLQDINMIAVPPYIHHFIDPYISFQNPNPNVNHTGDDYKYYNLARLLIRSLSNQTYLDTAEPLKLSMLENILGYFELNPVTRLELPTSVKFVIVIFDKVWGTKKAEMVRNVCMNNNWVLIWASDNNFPRIRPPKPSEWTTYPHWPYELQFQANLRILDPIVLNKLNKNITIPSDITTKFEEMTETVTSKQWDTMKYQFGQSILSVEPVKFNDCSSKDCLAVVVNDRTCLC